MSREPQDHELTPAERELAAALRGIHPAAPTFDPIAVAFAAGLARRSQSIWLWRSAAALLAVALGVSLIARSATRPTGTPTGTVIVHRPAPTESVTTYLTMETRDVPSPWRLRERVLDQGLDALDVPTHAPALDDGEPVLRAGDPHWRSS